MLLVDKNIRHMVSEGELISTGFCEANLNSISYDLTIDDFPGVGGDEVDLLPGEFVIIKTKEELKIPLHITGRIGEKNSLLRMGLKVDGPQYQPGHQTYAFLRVQNISDKVIVLHSGKPIAQIFFEELKEAPDMPYNLQPNCSFQNETEYRNFGRYEAEYNRNMKSFEKVKDDIEGLTNRIYGNVLTLMGILVSIFTLLTINYQAFTNADLSPRYIVLMNLSLAFCISVMLGIILFLINEKRQKHIYVAYGVILALLGIAVVVFCLI
ncbi:MAG: hypothetical protein HFI93_03480 [Lachnospiraceae bacterium]|nr:hypothetical protein [Lachnospiraceae bacterium]